MRSATAVLLVAVLAVTAGCSGVSLSGDAVELDAGETVVDEATAQQAGYELEEAGTEELNETVEAGGREIRVVVRNHVAVYEKGGPGGTAAASVGVVTMPDASVARQNLNPLVRMNETQLLKQFAEQGDAAMEFEEVDNYTVQTLGGEADVTVYRAESEDNPDAYVHLLRDSPAETDDAVLAYAMYPVQAEQSERENVEELMGSLEYTPADADGETESA